jgi:DNA-binding MarR family transcriptional regulator
VVVSAPSGDRSGRTLSPADAAATRQRLSDALGALRRITGSPRLERRVAVHSGVPIGLSAVAVLGQVVADGPLRLSDLARLARMHPAALTRQVQALEAEGYIERRPDPDDGRAAVVQVTSSGRSALRRVQAANDDIMSGQLADWSPDELEALVTQMERLITDLRTPPGRSSAAG